MRRGLFSTLRQQRLDRQFEVKEEGEIATKKRLARSRRHFPSPFPESFPSLIGNGEAKNSVCLPLFNSHRQFEEGWWSDLELITIGVKSFEGIKLGLYYCLLQFEQPSLPEVDCGS